MRSYVNPFRVRATEHLRDERAFLRNFAVDMLRALPPDPYDVPLLLRSPPGSGKTSLMRLFTTGSLLALREAHAEVPDLAEALQGLGAVDAELRPLRLGVLLSMERDYAALLDAGAPPDAAGRMFLRLLDARVLSACIRAAARMASSHRAPSTTTQESVKLVPRSEPTAELSAMLAQVGATEPDALTGGELRVWADRVERELRRLLNDLSPVDWRSIGGGHHDLLSLRILSGCDLLVGGTRLDARPLVMLDDGHLLGQDQRAQVLGQLSRRDCADAGLWFAERYDALAPEDVIATAGEQRRDHRRIDLSSDLRGPTGKGRSAYERLLIDVGSQRAAPALQEYAGTTIPFHELLDADEGPLDAAAGALLADLDRQLFDLASSDGRFAGWALAAGTASGGAHAAAVHRRAALILIERYRQREQAELFADLALPESKLAVGIDSGVREAAELFLAREHQLPYYFGSQVLVRLGSHNVAQFLDVSADLFDRMLSEATLGSRVPRLAAARQHAINMAASERLWREIPTRIEGGRDVQALLAGAARMGRTHTYTARASYAPGVTGFAITMGDQQALADPSRRPRLPEGDRVAAALGRAIAHNLLRADVDLPRGGDRIMRLYLNRLLCPRFWLPLGRGGWRTRRLDDVARWITTPTDESDRDLETPLAEQLAL